MSSAVAGARSSTRPWTGHGRPGALKVIRPEISATIALDRFLREIGIGASLQRPNVVPLLDSGEAGGLPYFATPFVEGASLRDVLAGGGVCPSTKSRPSPPRSPQGSRTPTARVFCIGT